MAQTSGKLTTARYKVATIFVDHYSDLDFVYIQESTSAEETIDAKKAFEQFANERGVKIKHYHADNGIFASNGFREEVENCGQGLSFCGVGAHHQNGIAERRIQDLTESARANLIHASHRNDAITAHLWPYALLHASHIRRLLPRQGNMKSPEELFSKTGVRPTTRFLHTFGCPVYVLKGKLQSGGTQPKWEERSRVGVYLGCSRQHATNVSLILNPQTGFISPQFHCVYDDQFDTCDRDKNFSKLWAEKAGLQLPNEEDPHDYGQKDVDEQFQVPFVRADELVQDQDEVIVEIPVVEEEEENQPNMPDEPPENIENHGEMEENEGAQPDPNEEAPRTSRSGRVLKRTQKMEESYMLPKLRSLISEAFHSTCEQNRLSDGSINELCKLSAHALPASIADNDTMYLREAMQQPDKDEFLKAMIKEIDDHTKRGHWRLTSVEEMRRRNYKFKPIMAIWSFKRKRSPTGEITKYKARLCCHGGQTVKGEHYDETFSPVVSWSTVRLMLTLALIHGWHARQMDFVLAFPQAKVRTDIYMHVPEKFCVQDGKLELNEQAPHPSKQRAVVKLIQNVYGLVDASYTWHQHVKKGILSVGFKQSKVDPCLFYKGNVLFILYVDDAVCLTPKEEDAKQVFKDLKAKGYVLTDEGPLLAFLGLQVKKEADGIELTQPAFIERIIEQVGLKDERMHDTPADTILGRDEEGQERKTDFHYRSVIGQLNYLAATTRPEIQFAVHQCARFSQDPKMSHEKAVKRIVRYLKRTKEKGLKLKMNKKKGIECYVDADFAGGYDKNNPKNPRDLLSRTGYVLKYAGCPLIWASKLQQTIALSTTESEYMALSTAMREVIYVMNLIDELKENGVDLIEKQPIIKCEVFEDNVGAIELAKLPKLRPRTKHIAVQYHHFRTLTERGLNGEDPRVKVQYITTALQEADIMTKPLPKNAFEKLRKLLSGW